MNKPTDPSSEMRAHAGAVTVVIPTLAFDRWFIDSVDSVLGENLGNVRVWVAAGCPITEEALSLFDPSKVTFIDCRATKGLGPTLAFVCEKVEDEFVARLDADDLSKGSRIRKQLEFLQTNRDVVLVGSQADIIDENGAPIGLLGTNSKATDARVDLLRRNVILHSSVMFRTKAYKDVGGYNSETTTYEDYELWLRLATIGEVWNMPERLVSYRVHSDQVSRKAKPFGVHTLKIFQAQVGLAKVLGFGSVSQLARFAPWEVAQIGNYLKLRKSGIDRQIDA